MATFRGFTVAMRVGDKLLPYYAPDVDDATRTTTLWFPSEAGQQYSIAVRQDAHDCASVTYLHIDGNPKHIASYLLNGKGACGEMKGHLTSASIVEPFVFANVTTTDDDAVLKRPTPAMDFGSVRLRIHRIRKPVTLDHMPNLKANGMDGIVHERTVKASSHTTRLGPAQPSEQTWIGYRCEPFAQSDLEPWVTFIFKYRPAAVLQALGHMPKPQVEMLVISSSPTPAASTPTVCNSASEAPGVPPTPISHHPEKILVAPQVSEQGKEAMHSPDSGSAPTDPPQTSSTMTDLEAQMLEAELRVLDADQAAVEARRYADELTLKAKRAALIARLKPRPVPAAKAKPPRRISGDSKPSGEAVSSNSSSSTGYKARQSLGHEVIDLTGED